MLQPGHRIEAGLRRGLQQPGRRFTRINRLAEAIRDLNKAIELNPAYADAYCNRAAVRLSAGRYDEALADCDKAIALRA